MDTLKYIGDKLKVNTSQKVVHLLDFSRNDLASLFTELGFVKGVEVGVLLGTYSEELCKRNKNLRLVSVDPYLVFPEYKDLTTQKQFDENYEKTSERLARYNCLLLRKKSMEALAEIENESMDFVYIDGNHEFTSEANDIHEWSKKVRVGGIISGHDYRPYQLRSYSHTFEVVNAYTQAYSIYPLFIIGRNVDRIRSWFWVKI